MQRKNILLLIFLLGGITLIIWLAITRSGSSTPSGQLPNFQPTPTQTAPPIPTFAPPPTTPEQKATIGVTTDSDIATLSGIISTETQPNDTKKYLVTSTNPIVPDEIITQHGKAVFESTPLLSSNTTTLPTVTDYMKVFGNPLEVIQGNITYGDLANSYLFPTQGIALIANGGTGQVYQVLQFTPMSHEAFDSLYGSYIQGEAPHKH